jgi:hypothetical protein
MSPSARTSSVVALIAGLGLSFAVTGPRQPDLQPDAVTTDSLQYCQELLARVSELIRLGADPSPDRVSFLATEGRHLCAEGQVRGGVLRLREAVMLMNQRLGSDFGN